MSCTNNPNNCRSGFCNWPNCGHEPTIAELGQDFTEANDKPPERDWSRAQRIGYELALVLAVAGFCAGICYMLISPFL